MTSQDLVMVGYHDYRLVALSVLVSILAAYTARDLAERVSGARDWAWLAWLVGGATADGIATWSMHYTGMLAFSLPVPVQYDWLTVLLSLVVGILGSAATLFVAARSKIGRPRAVAASILLGSTGISGMHYTAMAAMRLQGMHHYSPALVALSVVLAIVLSLMALSLIFLFRDDASGRSLRNHGSAVLRGMANPVMHYTAMAAVTFTYSSEVPNLSHAVSISSLGILGISIVPVMVLVVALLTSLVDRLQKQRSLLNELFEQAPQAVVLMNVDHRVVRVNREFTRVFGYTLHETLGRRLSELIVPDELQDEVQQYANLVAHGQRVDAEGVRQRQDGSRLPVAIVHVPVSLPSGEIAVYAIYRDITERKQAEEALRTYPRRLIETQEAERQRIAREMHDEIGQALTAIRLNLQVVQSSTDASLLTPQLQDSIDIVDRTLQQVRDLAFDLRPSQLDDLGLVAALRSYADREAQRAGFIAEFVADLSETRVPAELETACFRIAQAAFTNVVRHAQASRVWVELRQRGAELHLVLRDNGVGFDVNAVGERRASEVHLGLQGMQERALILGGQLDITSAPGRGTEIHARFPLMSSTPPQSRERDTR